VLVRCLIVGALVLAMQLPLAMVEGVVDERGERYRQVVREIAVQWGESQRLVGPILVVPYREKIVAQKREIDDLGRWRPVERAEFVERTAVALPRRLELDLGLAAERRRRGLFEVLVYAGEVRMDALFARPEIATLSDKEVVVDWDKARIVVGLSDTQAIRSVTPPTWAGAVRPVAPEANSEGLLDRGFHVPLGGWPGEAAEAAFSLAFAVNGSGGFRFAPLGEATAVAMRADWPHPSFQGTALPVSHRVGDDGFEAEWQIPSLARGHPQLWRLDKRAFKPGEALAGVDLAEPVDLYTRLTRATKYGVLYVALSFLTFLVFELSLGQRLHLVQYALIGLALALFYLTLLSLAEHVAFATAYLAAAAAIVAMVTLYAWAALRRLASAAVAGLALAALYGVLYTLLQMEDFALLAGTGLLLLVLALLMLVTRNLGAAPGLSPAARA
jgi:inner membrane protein